MLVQPLSLKIARRGSSQLSEQEGLDRGTDPEPFLTSLVILEAALLFSRKHFFFFFVMSETSDCLCAVDFLVSTVEA